MCLDAGSTWSFRWTGVVRDAKRSVLLSRNDMKAVERMKIKALMI